MTEFYKKLQPLKEIDKELYVEAIHDDYEGLRIILTGRSNGSGVMRIEFDQYYIYRNVDESNRIRLWNEGNFEDKKWSLFEVENSNIITWLIEENGEIFDLKKIKHYFIKTDFDVVDIVTNQLPKFEWLLPVSDDSTEREYIKYSKRSIHKLLK